MYIQQMYTNCLAQAAYYIESKGEAVVIDPLRDPDPYIELARSRNAQIRFVLETHFHADFVSGHLELARKTGAVIVYGPGAKPDYQAAVLKDHDVIDLGDIKIMLLHTPGHTIESSCYLIFDEEDKVHSVCTGDTLFIGDVGRPDLMSGNLDKEVLGGMLFDSLQNKIKVLPDETIVYPGHGAGSACGKNLGKETVSTIGEQKAHNYALQIEDRNTFIATVCADQPAAPAYFFKDAHINIHGYGAFDKILQSEMVPLSAEVVQREQGEGALILDTRPAAIFAKGFIPGSLHIGLNGEFAIWAGTLVAFNTPLIIVAENGKAEEAIKRLGRIGYDSVLGYLEGGFEQWEKAGLPVEKILNISNDTLIELMETGKYALLDVRKPAEVEKDRLLEAHHIPLNIFKEELDVLDKHNQYIVYCAGGYRSMMACSMLHNAGFTHVMNLAGGIDSVRREHPEVIQVSELV